MYVRFQKSKTITTKMHFDPIPEFISGQKDLNVLPTLQKRIFKMS